MSMAAEPGSAGPEERVPFLYLSAIFPPRGGAEPRCNLTFVRTMCRKGFLQTVVTVAEGGGSAKDVGLERMIPPGNKARSIGFCL